MPIAQALGEAGVDFHRRQHIATVKAFAEVRAPRGISVQVKITAGGKVRHQLAALLRIVQIEHGQRHVFDVQRSRVTKHEHLNDGRAKEQPAQVWVPQRMDEFLPHHVADAPE